MTKREERVNSQNGGIEQWCTRGEGSKRQKAKVGGERERVAGSLRLLVT